MASSLLCNCKIGQYLESIPAHDVANKIPYIRRRKRDVLFSTCFVKYFLHPSIKLSFSEQLDVYVW